jgi:hypothetical protein
MKFLCLIDDEAFSIDSDEMKLQLMLSELKAKIKEMIVLK